MICVVNESADGGDFVKLNWDDELKPVTAIGRDAHSLR
jgi:hypothetical protein